jgi:hypothetical protein
MEEIQPFLSSDAPHCSGSNPHDFKHMRFATESECQRRWYKTFPLNKSYAIIILFTSMAWICVFYTINFVSTKPTVPTSQPLNANLYNNGFLTTETDYLTCGHSPEEAHARGCTYDILSNHWHPKECLDEKSVKEYQMDDSWWPFADANHTIPLNMDELGFQEFYYTSLRDHIVHCAVLWRRQYRAWTEGWRYLDDVLIAEHHSMHCSQFLIDMTDRGEDLRKIPIKVYPGRAGCHVKKG